VGEGCYSRCVASVDAIRAACTAGQWNMVALTPADSSAPPPFLGEIAAAVGWTPVLIDGRWALVAPLHRTEWATGAHQAVAHRLLDAMVPGIGPRLVGQLPLEDIRLVDPDGGVFDWDLEEVDPGGHLRAAWRPGNTSQAANFLAAGAGTAPSIPLPEAEIVEVVPPAARSLADEMFGY